jgi:gamma-glutamyltranspeptidase
MSLAEVLAPAIEIAEAGIVPDWYLALKHAHYLEELAAFPETARTYLRNGRSIHRPPSMQPGDVVPYPDLARSLALIARQGPSAFYRGALAEAISEEMKAHGGVITKADLAAYEVRVGPALRGRYRDVELALSPGAGDAEHPRRVPGGESRLEHGRGSARARHGQQARVPGSVRASRRRRRGEGAVGATGLARARA